MRDGDSITLVSGQYAHAPVAGSAAVSLVGGAIESFAAATALEAPRGIRVNVVSPPWVTESAQAMGMPATGTLPAATVAQAFVRSVTGSENGAVIAPSP